MASMLFDPRLLPLLKSIRKIVSEDLSAKDSLQEDEIVSQLFHDIASFDDWMLVPGDPRNQPDRATEQTYVLPRFKNLRAAIPDVVDFNLKGMEEVGESNPDYDREVLINKLIEYVIFWKQWYYDLKYIQDIEAYYEDKGIHEGIYEGDYSTEDTTLGGVYYAADIPTKGS